MRQIEKREDFNTMVLENEKLVVLDLYADWCGPCKAMVPMLEILQEKYKDSVEIIKLDVENIELQEVVQQFRVRSIPTIVFIKNQEVKEAKIGAQSMPVMETVIQKFS